jgi:NADPH-dependent glutamate synthase beta chain and related oxidoreductases
MRIAVIGCGPAGLAAAHAAHGLGAGVTIYSPGQKSPQRGPLVLQRPIPAISTDHPDGYIKQLVIGGSILDYRYKLYGDINISIQGDQLREGYHCWEFIKTYDKLWELYMEPGAGRAAHVNRMITPQELTELHYHVDLVINTAPLNKLCYREHGFQSKAVEITWSTRTRTSPRIPLSSTPAISTHGYGRRGCSAMSAQNGYQVQYLTG